MYSYAKRVMDAPGVAPATESHPHPVRVPERRLDAIPLWARSILPLGVEAEVESDSVEPAAVDALAVTTGRHIALAPDAPNGEAGRRAMAHELAHVVQQTAPDAQLARSSPVTPQRPEAEAAWAADVIVRGGPTPRLSRASGSPTYLGRGEETAQAEGTSEGVAVRGAPGIDQDCAEALLESPTSVTRRTQGLINAEAARGTTIERPLREEMESLLGVTLQDVRLHRGGETDTLAQRLGANAFTQGWHVFLRSDRDPDTSAGRKTLAHELAHVAQGAPSVDAVMRQPQTRPLQQPQQVGIGKIVGRSLLELRDKENPSADEIRNTHEYASYMDPRLVWQQKFGARPEEALEACRSILYHLKWGESIDWSTRALEFLLQARELLGAAVADKAPPANLVAKHHYRIELKAWIPHAQVVDPVPGLTDSHYRGDDHRGYDGSWRVLNWVGFDWDGKKMSGFNGGDNYGTTHRDWKRWGLSGTEEETQTRATGRDINNIDGYFTMWISSRNPIPLVPAPEINSTLDVMLGCDSISFVYITDEFPSHGVRVVQDGKVVETKVIFDASTVDGSDALEIFVGLTDFDNKGDFDVPVPPDLAACQSGSQPSATPPP
jgi:hypothetical protein